MPSSATRPVIGIEVHCQLRTASKMFCACSTAYDGAAAEQPRLPGLPRAAGRAADDQPAGRRARPRDRRRDRGDDARRRPAGTARTTSTRTCRRATRSASTTCRSRRRAADLRHVRGPVHGRRSPGPTSRRTPPSSSTRPTPDGRKVSLVDFNRSGAPLMEIVTEPDIRTAEQARRYAEELQLLLRAIGASRRGHGARARCGSRPTSRSGRAAPSRSGRGSRSRT